MGRGAQAQTMQMTDQQLANQNVMNQALYNQASLLSSKAAGSYLSLLANPGYTPAQQSAFNNQSLGALSSAFGALAQSAANRLARTRNSAGYGDLLDELAREQGRQTGSVALQNHFGFANPSRSRERWPDSCACSEAGRESPTCGRAAKCSRRKAPKALAAACADPASPGRSHKLSVAFSVVG